MGFCKCSLTCVRQSEPGLLNQLDNNLAWHIWNDRLTRTNKDSSVGVSPTGELLGTWGLVRLSPGTEGSGRGYWFTALI